MFNHIYRLFTAKNTLTGIAAAAVVSLLTVSAAHAQIFTQVYTTPTSDGSTTFLIPDGVTSIQIQAWGGGGAGARGGSGGGQGGAGGGGGFAGGTVSVTPGQILTLLIGGGGTNGTPGEGGMNGGGPAYNAGSGGGYSAAGRGARRVVATLRRAGAGAAHPSCSRPRPTLS